jgi:hypothetical protein
MQRHSYRWIILALVLIALVGYILPWLHSHAAGLTLGAYDLAEWSSLHPEVRTSAPWLLTTLLLRLPLIMLGWITALAAPERRSPGWWLHSTVVVALLVALLPPLEFLNAPADVNYRQQAILAAMLLAGSLAGLFVLPHGQWRLYAISGFSFIAVSSAIIGLAQSANLLSQFNLDVEIGLGIILLGGCLTLTAGLAVRLANWWDSTPAHALPR